MKLVFLADIHGNIVALEQLLHALRGVSIDAWFFLGDAIGYFPEGEKVLNRLRGLNCQCVKGNHEQMLLEKNLKSHPGDSWSSDDLGWIHSWPEILEVQFGEKRILCAHGSPRAPLREYLYPDSNVSFCAAYPFDYIFCAHSHRPFFRPFSHGEVWNTGSIGLPRDGSRKGSCILADTRNGEIKHFFVNLDIDAMRIRYARSSPEALARIMRHGE